MGGYYATNYQTHAAGTGTSSFTWTLNVPSAGTYEAYARWTQHPNRATNAKYTVNHAGGATQVIVNQVAGGGTWSLLGTYSFDAGAASVSLTDQANGYVIADAIRLVPVAIQAEQKLYFVHTDHLNTPRLVADATGTTVWRWDQQEPFGANPADEDPDANSVAFELPLRFPGQYADKETGVAYNFLRDYSSDAGRYIQSDPIGLEGGINTYLYVGGTPLSWSDPFGLKSFQCIKPLDSLGGKGSRSGPDVWGNPAYHQYSCVIDENGQMTCGGQDRTGSALSSPGKPSNDKYDPKLCMATQDDKCFDGCLKKRVEEAPSTLRDSLRHRLPGVRR